MAHPRRSPEDVERGLTALILAGSSTQASDVCGIPAPTLRAFKRDHADRYERLQKDLEPRIVDKIAAEAEGIVLELADVQRLYVQKMRDSMDDLKPGEIPGALRNAATAAALNIDKLSSPLRERPSHVQQGSDVEGLLVRMAKVLGHQPPLQVANHATVEGSAVTLSEGTSVTLSTPSIEPNVRKTTKRKRTPKST